MSSTNSATLTRLVSGEPLPLIPAGLDKSVDRYLRDLEHYLRKLTVRFNAKTILDSIIVETGGAVVRSYVCVDPTSSSTSWFLGGAYFPPGKYRVYYWGGSLFYAGETASSHQLNKDASLTGGYLVAYDPDGSGSVDSTVKCPGDHVLYASQTEVESANKGLTTSYTHLGGMIGVRCGVSNPSNVADSPSPVFGLGVDPFPY